MQGSCGLRQKPLKIFSGPPKSDTPCGYPHKKKKVTIMRLSLIAVAVSSLLASLPALAAPTWQSITSEPGKRIELDRTSIKREGATVQATGRVVLEKELPDLQSGGNYRVIEALTKYDCGTRSASTLRRVYKKNESEVLRDEEVNGPPMLVRSGTLDDKVLREVCRPPKEGVAEVAQKANEATSKLKEANDAVIKKELAKAGPTPVIKTVDNAEAEKKTVHSPEPVVKTIINPAPKPRPKKAEPDAHAAKAVHEHAHIHWAYEGEGAPDNWAKLDPKNKLCASGQRQSPIDIRDGIKVDLEAIQFDYRPGRFKIVDNGHTIQVEPGTQGQITLGGKSYSLLQFHFHKPAEERVNGKSFAMVAHLVHKADDGSLAVVAVLMEPGVENPFVQTLWNHMPLDKNMPVEHPAATIDLNNLLPAARGYYTYMGSLTTPPCSEGVLWLVLKQPVQVSQEQINIFSRLYRNNARPIQPTSGRLIKDGR